MGLARTPAELSAALWEMDIRQLQQLVHASAVRMGARLRWTGPGGGDPLADNQLEELRARPFSWPENID